MKPSPAGWTLTQLVRAVRACRPIAMRRFRSSRLRVERKADGSPVTVADRLIEERLRRVIGRLCPGEPIVGEEGGAPVRVGETYWTIDPIDGTRAFSCGLPTWAIPVGKVERGRPVVTLIVIPCLYAMGEDLRRFFVSPPTRPVLLRTHP